MKVGDFISVRDLEKNDIDFLLDKAEATEKKMAEGCSELDGKVVATLFFEPSTRTRLSFQTAAQRLGAKVIDFGSTSGTSMVKGETFTDTIKIVDGYADLLVIRHSVEGAARYAAKVAEHPVINAGDGGNQHPTQMMLDLYTIRKLKKKIDGLNVCLVGDLKYGRVMRSLMYGLAMYKANVTLISPKGLEMDVEAVKEVKQKFNAEIIETNEMNLRDADVLYVCRIQKERFTDVYEAERVQKEFRVTKEQIDGCKKDMVILHPLPKIDEIDLAIDKSPHAKYFEQAKNGVPVRMAIISELLKKK
ncbi:aspartate carbamoyltransferase [Candidatus Micrarchaeota archaeon]|nr:aspartate carbamoyltransferase [Candidatus Micrarchaeota archaeon]